MNNILEFIQAQTQRPKPALAGGIPPVLRQQMRKESLSVLELPEGPCGPCRCPRLQGSLKPTWMQPGLLPDDALVMSSSLAALGDHPDVSGVCSHLRTCQGPWPIQPLRTTSGLVVLTQPRACVDVSGPCYQQSPCGDSWSGLPSEAILMSMGGAEPAPPLSRHCMAPSS